MNRSSISITPHKYIHNTGLPLPGPKQQPCSRLRQVRLAGSGRAPGRPSAVVPQVLDSHHPVPAFSSSLGHPNKPFCCPVCPFRATHNSKVQSHMRTHTGERPFSCHLCPASFARKGNLKTHIRTHTGEKPYACPHCKYCCAHKSDLKKHMFVHTR
ncbi:early growth response protein 2-like [Penaeus indicus]|uniref:early growth response protein 2-like n=1 Tax=Penaeus indicus TaxID=29960 RepID=UPI00300D326A